MKFIHCADLHLDSKLESNLPAEKAKLRKNELLTAFSDMLDFASQNGVKAIIIAGDMFDTGRISAKTKEFVKGRIENHKDIEFLILTGNHDENNFLTEETPENVFIFSNENKQIRFGNICVTGLSQQGISAYQSLALNPDDVNIVVMHGQEARTVENETVCIPELQNKNIDYLALGHIHSYKCARLDLRGEYCYSGCLEGRGFDECGIKGFVLLEVEDKVEHSFIAFAKRTIYEIEVPLDGVNRFCEIESAVDEATKNISADSLLKVVLTGSIYEGLNTDIEFIQSRLKERFFFVKVEDKTRIYISPEEYMNDISLKGEFIRLVMKSKLDDEEKNSIIAVGLRALRGEEIL